VVPARNPGHVTDIAGDGGGDDRAGPGQAGRSSIRITPPQVLLRRVIPAFGLLLAEHNAGRPPERQLRVRVVVHAGTVFYDSNGCFGEILDAAFRLLDAPCVKGALQAAQAPLVLVVSVGLDGFVHTGQSGRAFPRLSVQVAGHEHEGRVSLLPG
jgi:hypothetical protein